MGKGSSINERPSLLVEDSGSYEPIIINYPDHQDLSQLYPIKGLSLIISDSYPAHEKICKRFEKLIAQTPAYLLKALKRVVLAEVNLNHGIANANPELGSVSFWQNGKELPYLHPLVFHHELAHLLAKGGVPSKLDPIWSNIRGQDKEHLQKLNLQSFRIPQAQEPKLLDDPNWITRYAKLNAIKYSRSENKKHLVNAEDFAESLALYEHDKRIGCILKSPERSWRFKDLYPVRYRYLKSYLNSLS